MITPQRKFADLALVLTLAALTGGISQAQTTTLDPAWRVTPDTSKPGFRWNYFQNTENESNNTARTELSLAGQLTDGTGALLPNLGDPTVVGAAIAEAAPANPDNGLLFFEIAGVINLNKVDGGAAGNFPGDALEPGLNEATTDSNGQAAEILTYLTLPAGTITMGVNSDDGFQTSSGSNPSDALGRVVLGEFNGGRGAADTLFTIVVQQAGTYAFRTIWENGGGDSNIEWFTVDGGGAKVLVNDLPNGGIPAYRAASGLVPPFVKSVTPQAVPRQVESAYRNVTVVLADGSTAVDPNSITLQIDGKAVPTTKVRGGNQVTVDTGVLAGFHAPGEAHTAVLFFKDIPGTYSHTEQWTFYNLENLILPASPVTGENFDSYPEATSEATTVPPGWVATNYTYPETPGWDLADVSSDAFLNWVMITTDTVVGIAAETLANDMAQTINGQPIDWMSGNLLFVGSDGRKRNIPDPDGGANISVGQISFVVSAPFNLSTVTNPVLTFSSGARLSGNKEQMTLEYSVDQGVNWLPAIYMRNATTIRLLPDGSYDAVAMCTEVDKTQIAQWPTPGVGPKGGNFGDMIAAPISQALAPYFANRNDGVAARRVEAIRLPQASRQSDVRLRLTHAGSCGWDWGVDNIAFYDIAPSTAPALTITNFVLDAATATINWAGGTGPYLLQRKSSLSDATWQNALTTPDKSASVAVQGATSFFRVVDGATTTVIPLTAFLSGDAERPATATSATGLGSFSLEGNTLTYNITFSGLSSPATAAHIHGPADTTASTGILIPLPAVPSSTSGTISGSVVVSDLHKGQLLSGLTYANIHTANNGGGEIRGQIGPTQLKAALNGANERPTPVVTGGTASGTLTRIGNQLHFNIAYSGLSSAANAAHIHGRAATSVAAGVLTPLPTPSGTSGTLSGSLTLDNATLSAIVDGLAYVNIHTANFGGGEIRGQITP